MIFKIADKATLNQLSATIPQIPDLRRSYDLVKIIHGKMGQDEFTRAETREEVYHWKAQTNELFTFLNEETTTLTLTGQTNSQENNELNK